MMVVPVEELGAGGSAGKSFAAVNKPHRHVSHRTIAHIGAGTTKPASPSVTGTLKGIAVGLYFVRRTIQAYVRAEIGCCGDVLAHDSPRSARGNVPWSASVPHVNVPGGSGTPEVVPAGLTQRDDGKREAKCSQGAHPDLVTRFLER